ncbi:sugar phosphate isomerase/epimerase family protein [Paenibacillus allorhizosphaerae]|uniref:Xylose isomerase-like TIM barrel domain-containing protein n=1 Tax=Paenibacillus allorhizosphaerae TaxID=2849866 RepID=A0ABN7TP91_9BACL|nr:TIM barrel protein [Paenibacillus allorhizosphaerae]CAG7642355.1 hypothetical protein PAECIP111802_02848 [Paenibacillus allorhizosphaerae]
MNRFLIGQHGRFDERKYKRDFKPGFYGIEACLLENEEHTARLIEESTGRGFQVGIHFPLRAGRSKLRDALFLSPDDAVRQQAYDYVTNELDYMAKVKPSYILFHYPKPVVLDDRVDWKHWRFADASEFVYESAYRLEECKEKSEALFEWLSDRGREYGFTPVLEFDALNRYVYATDMLEELLLRYPDIRLCLDTGRLFLQHKLDPYFDAAQVIRRYAVYADLIHLSNTQFTDRVQCHHYPVLPELDPGDGWAPIARYLGIVRERNPNVNILFEHRSDAITDEQLERCYAWVEGLLNAGSANEK